MPLRLNITASKDLSSAKVPP